jgi:hypothetical protein
LCVDCVLPRLRLGVDRGERLSMPIIFGAGLLLNGAECLVVGPLRDVELVTDLAEYLRVAIVSRAALIVDLTEYRIVLVAVRLRLGVDLLERGVVDSFSSLLLVFSPADDQIVLVMGRVALITQ